MKNGVLVDLLAYFFNDIIGAVVPGLLLISILVVSVCGFVELSGGWFWIMLAASYASGHLLLSINQVLHKRCSGWAQKEIAEIKESESFKEFAGLAKTRWGLQKNASFNETRSVAMSVSAEAASLARRFMFISLLCYGTSIALLVVILWLTLTHWAAPDWIELRLCLAEWLMVLLIGLGSSLLLQLRGWEFEWRAQRIPFAVALAELEVNR